MRRNVELNELGPKEATVDELAQAMGVSATAASGDDPVTSIADVRTRPSTKDLGKVRVNEGDAWQVMELPAL